MKLYFISLQSSNFTLPFTGRITTHATMPGYIPEILVSILFDPNAFIQVYTAGIQTPNLLDVNLLPCPCL